MLYLNFFRRSFSTKKQCSNYKVITNENKVKINQIKSNELKKKIKTKKHLPLWMNATILLIFCMLGGLVYIAAGIKICKKLLL